jgi:predicted DNA-binding protein
MSISKNKIGVLINMDKELKAKLEKLAKEDNRSLTSYINNILKKHINSIEEN